MGNGHSRPLAQPAQASKLVALTCAISAGAHAGLVPEHLNEEPRMGVAFLVAVCLLLATGTAAALRQMDRRVALASALLFAGLIVGYTASRTSGIPLLSPDPESVDVVGVLINAVEALGLAAALAQLRPNPHRLTRSTIQEVRS
jgi:apolipoprotein N-acyltransferase